MIINFTLENWMSFRDPVALTMLSGEEDDYRNRLSKLKDNSCVLPIAAIFGGNASGKSNFVKSLKFARNFIIDGSKANDIIPVNTFKLDKNFAGEPAKFSFILLVNDKIFSYEFAVTQKEVVYEAYYEIKDDRKISLYRIKNGKIYLKSDFKHRAVVKNVFNHKRKDQLLLTTLTHLTDINFPVFDWFANELKLLQPNSKNYADRLKNSRELREKVNEIIRNLDCGVDSINTEKNSSISEIEYINNKINKKINISNETKEILESIPAYNVNDNIVTFHETLDGDLMKFEITEESDGTKRLFEIIPMFIELSENNTKKVIVIDEFDSNIHTKLSCMLINEYLTNCNSSTRSQLIFTTHNVQFMDYAGLRRDEIWLTERNKSGITDLFSLEDFKDIDLEEHLQMSYLIGRYGGNPELSVIDYK